MTGPGTELYLKTLACGFTLFSGNWLIVDAQLGGAIPPRIETCLRQGK